MEIFTNVGQSRTGFGEYSTHISKIRDAHTLREFTGKAHQCPCCLDAILSAAYSLINGHQTKSLYSGY